MLEIERKFLVLDDSWRYDAQGNEIVGRELIQGYIAAGAEAGCSLRVRLDGDKARLNIKSRKSGLSRSEFDLDVPYQQGRQILEEFAIKPYIEKTRYLVPHCGHTWEVDVFAGENTGLVLAEIELESEDEEFEKPGWLGAEVSADKRYYNAFLAENPFTTWGK